MYIYSSSCTARCFLHTLAYQLMMCGCLATYPGKDRVGKAINQQTDCHFEHGKVPNRAGYDVVHCWATAFFCVNRRSQAEHPVRLGKAARTLEDLGDLTTGLVRPAWQDLQIPCHVSKNHEAVEDCCSPPQQVRTSWHALRLGCKALK